jgi:uncharacterized protein (DUF2336 family)
MAGLLDVSYLLEVAEDPRTAVRTDLATQLAALVASEETGAEERAAVTPVLLRLADDAVVAVRKTLAEAIAHTPHAPREVLRALVCDMDEICVPLLESTPAMPDSDLAAVAKTGPATRRLAIARRRQIGAKLARFLIEVGSPVVCVRLMRNPGCRLDKAAFDRIVALHGSDPSVIAAMRKREDLPVHVAAQLMEDDADDLVIELVPDGSTRKGRGGLVLADQREKAIIRLIDQASGEAIEDLIAQLFRSGTLTTSLILRAAFIGNMDFVARALAQLGTVPLRRVRSLLYGRARLGSRAIYLRAGLPDDGYRAFRVALDVFHAVRIDDAVPDRGDFGRRIVERVVTGYEDFSTAEQKMLLDLLVRLGTEETRRLAAQLADRLSMVDAA